jgi:hypothetical protein
MVVIFSGLLSLFWNRVLILFQGIICVKNFLLNFCDFNEFVRCGTSRLWQDHAISKIELQTAVFHLLHE